MQNLIEYKKSPSINILKELEKTKINILNNGKFEYISLENALKLDLDNFVCIDVLNPLTNEREIGLYQKKAKHTLEQIFNEL
jgi:hypothetical protein